MKPLLSIVTASFNDLANLEVTINSVELLSQIINVEHIVIDGKSTDGTISYLKNLDFPWMNWISDKDRGIYDAMNKGLKRTNGRYVQFLNAGDWIIPENMQKLRTCLEEQFDVLIGAFNVVDSTERILHSVQPKPFCLENIGKYGTACLNHQSIFIQKNICPSYDTRFRFKGELNWYIDILKHKTELNVGYLMEPVLSYRAGGLGSKHLLRNLLEWLFIVQMSFGLVQNLRNFAVYRKFWRSHRELYKDK